MKAKIIGSSKLKHNFKDGSIVDIVFVDGPTKLYPHTLLECKQGDLVQTVREEDVLFIKEN